MDDVHAQYSKIPKKIVAIVAILCILIMLIVTFKTVKEQAAQVEEQRKVANDTNKTGSKEVEIKIDEQSWKHYQNKKIELLAEKTDKQIEEVRQEVKKTSNIVTESVKEELKNTISSIEEMTSEMKNNMGGFENTISQKIDEKIAPIQTQLDKNNDLIKSQEEAIKKINTASSAGAQAGLDSKLLPPPLKAMREQPKRVVPEKIEIVEPGSKDYDYSLVRLDETNIEQGKATTALLSANNKEEFSKNNFHIMKGLVGATLLTGIDAPTFGGADNDQNRRPALFSIDGDTIIANDETQMIENCLIGGSATGNVNNSKADILLTDISCSGYNSSGKKIKIEQKINGWVIGEDGSFGLEGRLLDSSGKVITKMIALEIIDSLSKTLQASALPSGTTTFGTSNANIPYNDAAARGAGAGVSKGIDKAFEHYDRILSGMYPTISVLPGKKVALYLKGGENLTPETYTTVDIHEKMDLTTISSQQKDDTSIKSQKEKK
jgi:biopolymer transport protein ExbD